MTHSQYINKKLTLTCLELWPTLAHTRAKERIAQVPLTKEIIQLDHSINSHKKLLLFVCWNKAVNLAVIICQKSVTTEKLKHTHTHKTNKQTNQPAKKQQQVCINC